jgi:dTDP-4-amino-4,6-dideoxygalactose transaminase
VFLKSARPFLMHAMTADQPHGLDNQRHMKTTSAAITRREFIATTSAFVVATQLGAQESKPVADAEKLALDGGPKAVQATPGKSARWGNAERAQLGEAVKQDSLLYWNGPQTSLFTRRFQEHHPLKHVMTCTSGTAAVHIAVAAADIAPGDEVITTAFTDVGTVTGILFQLGVPVFADLDPHNYMITPESVEKCITPKTKAIIAVHLSGNPGRLAELRALADKHKLILIEDCAQAWGAAYRGKPVGNIGHAACFSLQQSKHITCGDGGVVASNDDTIGPRLRRFGDKGTDRGDKTVKRERLATNYRMSELLAAFAAAQCNRLEGIAEKRSRLGDLLSSELAGVRGVSPPRVDAGNRCTYWNYLLRLKPSELRCDRATFAKALAAEGLSAGVGYIPELLYEEKGFRNHSFFGGRWPVKEMGLTTMDYNKVKLPEAESIRDTVLNIRIFEAMDEEYVRQMAHALRKVAKHFAA